ncbi:MAG TPA: polysaccharide biosynthesis/export family protein [Terriglobales bacterium]|nr:polysaccharide biosynthesis/export family protein [Terriglobales bacterium]
MKSARKAAVAALVLISSIALAQDSPAQPAASPASDNAAATGKTTTAASSSPAGPDYVIGAEDVLHISVWKEADLTATLPVRPDGKISLPLLNDVQASGLTPQQLADSVTEKLRKYVADPRVTVVVTAINSKRIYLVGEVLHTGAVSMLPNMTVMQALSSAGLNQFANTKRIYVLRNENGKQVKLPVNYRKLVKGNVEQNYVLQPGDTIVVP